MSAQSSKVPHYRFSHMGLATSDLPRMEQFYTEVLGFTVTDRGFALGCDLVFLSRDPADHHQVVLGTGRSLLEWHEEGNAASLDAARAAKIFLMPNRDELMRRIDARFDAMMAAGALDEVRALAARKLAPDLPAMKAHGVPWLIRHFGGEIILEEAVEGAKRDTRQYTKRQATWFRNQLPEFAWVEPDKALAAVEAQLRDLTE